MPQSPAELEAEIARLRAALAEAEARAGAAEALAERDPLTGALNRRGFLAALRRTAAACKRYGRAAALLYLDMDGFKTINDDLGHAAGDAALVRVAEILAANVRESDAVGRLGGDEFAVLLDPVDELSARAKARALSDALEADPFAWDGRPARLAASFGVRAWSDHDDAEAWLAEADAAMFVRKRTAR